jgi:hypothetical protein
MELELEVIELLREAAQITFHDHADGGWVVERRAQLLSRVEGLLSAAHKNLSTSLALERKRQADEHDTLDRFVDSLTETIDGLSTLHTALQRPVSAETWEKDRLPLLVETGATLSAAEELCAATKLMRDCRRDGF